MGFQYPVVLQSQKVKGEGKKRIVAVLPPGDDSNSTEVLNSANKGLGLREWLESKGHEYIVTADKDLGTGIPLRPHQSPARCQSHNHKLCSGRKSHTAWRVKVR